MLTEWFLVDHILMVMSWPFLQGPLGIFGTEGVDEIRKAPRIIHHFLAHPIYYPVGREQVKERRRGIQKFPILSGDQTWLAGKSCRNWGINRKVTYFYGPVSIAMCDYLRVYSLFNGELESLEFPNHGL